jgi:hypothetical protein
METSLSGWDLRVEEWMIAKCDTVGDRETAERMTAANVLGNMASVGVKAIDRELCFDAALAPEQAKRRASM